MDNNLCGILPHRETLKIDIFLKQSPLHAVISTFCAHEKGTNIMDAMVATKKPGGGREVTISPPAFQTATFKLIGTSPYMQARFSEKAKEMMKSKMIAGSTSSKGKKRSPRDFDSDYHQAMHIMAGSKKNEKSYGIPASAFRAAAISACRVVGFKMTVAKLSLFVEADGFDDIDSTPLVKIEGEPERNEMLVRNQTGVADIRIRPIWRNWSCDLRVRFDTDQFSLTDVANLLNRVGSQVGVGEGRPDSKSSNGLGFGLFRIAGQDSE